MKKMKSSTLRALVAGAVVVIVAIGYFTKIGIGNVSGFGFDIFSLLCPLGYLESLFASKTFVPRAFISFVAVVVLVILLGRVFCSWICPMPFLQKIFPGKKKKKSEMSDAQQPNTDVALAASADDMPKTDAACATYAAQSESECVQDTAAKPAAPNTFSFDSRFGVLLGALGSAAIFGFPVFCLICPVGLTFATVYLVMRLFAFGEVTWTVLLVPAILLVEVVFFRKWCKKICPLGALISLISGANKTLRPHIDDSKCLNSTKGINCLMCAKSCPEHINIRLPEKSAASLNNCTKCKECSDHCPASAISFPFIPKKAESSKEDQVK